MRGRRRILLRILVGTALILALGPFLIPLPAQPDLEPEALARPGGSFLAVDDARLYVEQAGPPEGQPVVLIHGFGGWAYSWRETLPALADAGYHAIAVDLRGFGLSDKTFEADHSHTAQAALVGGAMDVLGIDRAAVVAHSMGGSVAAHLALANPGRVSRLVFVDAAIREPGAGGIAPSGLIGLPPVRRWGQLAVRLLATHERLAGVLRSAYADPRRVTADVVDGYLAPLRTRDWDLALLAIARDGGGNALPRPIGELAMPMLIIWGAADTWIPLSDGEALHRALPSAAWAVIPGAGHLPFEEQPEAFADVLVRFLAAAGE